MTSCCRRPLARGRRGRGRRRWLGKVRRLATVAVVYGEHVGGVAVMVPGPPRVRGAVRGQPLVQVLQVLVAGHAAPHARGQQIRRTSGTARRLLAAETPRRRVKKCSDPAGAGLGHGFGWVTAALEDVAGRFTVNRR